MRRRKQRKAKMKKGAIRTRANRVKGHTRNPRGPDRGKPIVHVRPYKRGKPKR